MPTPLTLTLARGLLPLFRLASRQSALSPTAEDSGAAPHSPCPPPTPTPTHPAGLPRLLTAKAAAALPSPYHRRYTWFDRDLSVAGRVVVKRGEKYTHELVKVEKCGSRAQSTQVDSLRCVALRRSARPIAPTAIALTAPSPRARA